MTFSEGWKCRTAAIVAACAVAGGLAGCGGEAEEPVARLAVEPARLELPYGSFATLRLRWSPRSDLGDAEESARAFLHLLDDEGDLVRTFDHDPPGAWRAGGELEYDARIYQSLLAPPLPPGAYTLTAGLYDAGGEHRWPLGGVGEPVGRSEYRVATVEVPATTGSGVPAVRFSPTWSPTLAGGDRQVVAFRWLTGNGSIELSDLASEGTLWLSVGIPREEERLRRRVVDPPEGGDDVPRVEVAASCSGFRTQVSGVGSHTLDVPVAPADGGCEVTVAPNYVMEAPSGDRRSLVLEVLAWRPAGGGASEP